MVYPNGDLMYPCAPLQTVAANLLEVGDYYEAVAAGIVKHGQVPYCDARCHVGCYMEASTGLTHPWEAALEVARLLRIVPRRTPTIRRPARPGPRPNPPSMRDLQDLPSIPAEETRRLRREGQLENDFTSRLRRKGQCKTLPLLVERGSRCAR